MLKLVKVYSPNFSAIFMLYNSRANLKIDFLFNEELINCCSMGLFSVHLLNTELPKGQFPKWQFPKCAIYLAATFQILD